MPMPMVGCCSDSINGFGITHEDWKNWLSNDSISSRLKMRLTVAEDIKFTVEVESKRTD